MNSVLPEKSEIGIWYKKVEFELDRFILCRAEAHA
jgi:hypothetical protein